MLSTDGRDGFAEELETSEIFARKLFPEGPFLSPALVSVLFPYSSFFWVGSLVLMEAFFILNQNENLHPKSSLN